MFRQKEERNDILSISKNFQKHNSYEKSNNHSHLKRLLLVYLTNDNQMFISRPAAFSLGLTNVRNVMFDTEDALVPITLEQINILKNKNVEIEFEELPEFEYIETNNHKKSR